MVQHLSLSRAARLVGITRGALQKKIKAGELETFEGLVSVEDLQRVYPQTRLEDNTLIENLRQLREGAYARRLRERLLPDAEVLAVRLAEFGRELATVRAELERYRAATAGLEADLTAFAGGLSPDRRQALESIRNNLRTALAHAGTGQAHHPLVARDSFMRVMVAHVQVLPSRHEFFVEGSDTLLESALRAGLALNYGCSNGNCGLCKARVVSGQVKKSRNHDFVLTEAEKAAGMVLMCSNTAVTDVVIEAEEAGSAQEMPLQQIATRVRTVEPLSDDMLLVHLQTPRTRRLRFLAGQSVKLQMEEDAPVDYPVASCPCDDRNLQFHVARTPANPFSARAFAGLKSGDTVNLLGPFGQFVLREESPHSLVFIAQDGGFAPIKSLIEHAMALDVAESLHLYWLARPGRGHYLNNLCRSWADALDNFHYTPLESGDTPAHPGSVFEQVVQDHPLLRDSDIYLSGSQSLYAAAREILPARGLPADQLICADSSIPG